MIMVKATLGKPNLQNESNELIEYLWTLGVYIEGTGGGRGVESKNSICFRETE